MRRAIPRLSRCLAVALVALFCALAAPPAVSPAAAQAPAAAPQAEIDYAAWETVATSAEALIEGGRASTAFFGARRAELVRWRAQFLAADTRNAERIQTIQSQIVALGPEPVAPAVEPAAIATRRAELAARLAEAQAPRLRASEAFNRANGLIAEIDAILAERQAQELLQLDPTPLNPVNWATALNAVVDLANGQLAQTGARLQDAETRAAMIDNAPALLGMVVFGLVLVLRARVWIARLGERFLDTDGRRGRTALGFVVSLGQLLMPLAGFTLIIAALDLSGLLTPTGETVAGALLGLILAVYAALWLGGRLFPRVEERTGALGIGPALRAALRRTVLSIGLFVGLGNMAEVVAALDLVAPAARGVLVVPFHVGLGLMYLRLAGLLKRVREELAQDDARSGFALSVMAIAGNALFLIGVIGPLLGLVGYMNAAEAVMIPTALSLFVLGVLLALQSVTRDLYAVIFRTTPARATEALLPVLVNFGLFVLAAPILAIAWGVRAERLQDVYARMLEGVALGDTRITPGVVLAVVLVFAGGLLLTRVLQGALRTSVLPRTRMDVGARNAVTAGVGYLGIALAALVAVTSAGIDLTALGFVLGALSVGIGFGLQNVVSNFVSGIILLIERPISEGDWIEVNGNMGIVRDISVRSTRIETFDKTDVIVPNADFISGTVTNWTRGNTIGRALVSVGVAYGSDTRRVQAILQEIAEGHPDVARFPEPGVDFMGFGPDSLDFRMRCILRDVNKMVAVKTELHHQIAERFAAEGIEIPFAQRDIWLRNPEALHARHPAPQGPAADPAPDPGPDPAPDPRAPPLPAAKDA